MFNGAGGGFVKPNRTVKAPSTPLRVLGLIGLQGLGFRFRVSGLGPQNDTVKITALENATLRRTMFVCVRLPPQTPTPKTLNPQTLNPTLNPKTLKP